MASSIWDDSARTHDGRQSELPPLSQEQLRRGDADEKVAALDASKNRDKIRCLDGLRGIACLIVFNYHFFWPWTPSIMLGHGAFPPRAPEPYYGWPSLPILCLLHRGRPMVAIFFAISGYVLCRHILRLIHERRLEAAYQKLASAVFRRVFRLYIPPTISMFLVAMLAQMGVFRSEFAIYKGPDSVYINGTVTVAQLNDTCLNGTFPAVGPAGVAAFLGLESSAYLNTTGWTDVLCLNATSKVIGPSGLYKIVDEYEAELADNNKTANDTLELTQLSKHATLKYGRDKHKAPHRSKVAVDIDDVANITNPLNLTWVQFGGSWEEHPHIHDNMTYALQNFTRSYAEWANPFNFGHYHPRYDPHTFTIPMELRGSMVIYLFLLGTAALKAKWRLGFGGLLSAYSLTLGRWDMATFLGGTILSELDIRQASDLAQVSPKDRGSVLPIAGAIKGRQVGSQRSTRGSTVMRWFAIFVALFLLSYPDAGAEYTPGFVFLSSLVPKYYIPLSGWMFYQSMGALLLLPCVLRSSFLRGILEGSVAQYLGRISFSLYLVHGPVLHSLGFWIMPRLFEHFGRMGGFVAGWLILASVTFYLTGWWHRKVDGWSVTVGRRIERALVD
ncbi:hypothetical protein FZEAL_5346 [Fusarium zealandicum]|uniref:Acyltransferase 3 domain-containing protein n=1 Tax=Fusarium zealandicum TaxID=1053134 RepID=A0A8H4UKD1_9HYPO|nr:hypothetical protein FZEAL_5346 [Fusarium zealandicum]